LTDFFLDTLEYFGVWGLASKLLSDPVLDKGQFLLFSLHLLEFVADNSEQVELDL